MTTPDIVSPLKIVDTDTCTMTPPWFVQEAEFHPCLATYKPLINGETAFAAVHHAIARAKKTVDIICWGFQPSMYFVRDGKSPCIGELLCSISRDKNVQVRILGWEAPFNSAGLGDEANVPGKGAIHIKARAGQSSTDQQYAYDKEWFAKNSFSGTCDDWVSEFYGLPGELAQKIHQGEKLTGSAPLFVGRGFNAFDRAEIMYQAALHASDKDISTATILTLGGTPTHHQKTVLVDYELPEHAVGFVMGHNMLDEYWDTDAHTAGHRTRDRFPPDGGPRGVLPRQDISSRVTGPILEHLHQNFAVAWKRATGQDLLALRNAKTVGKQLKPRPELGTPVMAQLLRTQAQEGRRDIEKLYLQNVRNATQSVYFENQYFRWPPLAEAIKQAAKEQTGKGRKPEIHGNLHVFVVTNVIDEGIGKGTLNTQRMLDSLGRADAIPGVVKQLEIEILHKPSDTAMYLNPMDKEELKKDYERQVEEIKKSTIIPESLPGLKIHVCSLVAQDSPADSWMPVYIHSKVMTIDDVFTTNGSANINTRSMQTDSEMNIAHEHALTTKYLRRRLWEIHTAGMGMQDDPEDAFNAWEDIINRNKTFQHTKKDAPLAPLIKFNYTEYKITDMD